MDEGICLVGYHYEDHSIAIRGTVEITDQCFLGMGGECRWFNESRLQHLKSGCHLQQRTRTRITRQLCGAQWLIWQTEPWRGSYSDGHKVTGLEEAGEKCQCDRGNPSLSHSSKWSWKLSSWWGWWSWLLQWRASEKDIGRPQNLLSSTQNHVDALFVHYKTQDAGHRSVGFVLS